jgi:malate dehydrogenase
MRVAIVGATGNVGKHTVLGLIQQRLLGPRDRLQLVGRNVAHILGLREDVLDAFSDSAPMIDVAFSIEEVVADVIVLVAGQNATRENPDRNWLAEQNLPIFQLLGRHLRRHGSGQELVIVVTNPVELAVLTIARMLDSARRVIGVGSYLDSDRFRKVLARELQCSYRDLDACVLGEHGEHAVPVWSSLRLRGRDAEYVNRFVGRLRQPYAAFKGEYMRAAEEMRRLLREADIQPAFKILDNCGPAVRALLLPVLCQASGAKTAVGTADKVCRIFRCIHEARKEAIPIQTALSPTLDLGLHTCIGVPVMLDMHGIAQVLDLSAYSEEDVGAIRQAGDAVALKIEKWTKGTIA